MTPVDQPALDDDVTARLFALSVQRVQAGSGGLLMVPVLVGASVFIWYASPLIGAVFAAVVPLMVWSLVSQMIPGAHRGPAAARRLLSEQPWWETPATVLDTRGTVLALPDGEHLKVFGLPAHDREVTVRAGRIWLVGPDHDGWYAVRVDGGHTPWPARRVAARDTPPARPTTEPIMSSWLRRQEKRARGDLWFAVVGGALVTVVAVLAGELWLTVLTVAAAAGTIGFAWWWLRRLMRMRHVGEWRRAEATVPSWTSRRDGRGDGTIALRFPDGHRYTAHLDGVPLDLFANAWREEALWVADGVVGFPHYPVIAFARLTPEP